MRSECQSAVKSFTYTFDDLRKFTVENEYNQLTETTNIQSD